MKLSLLSQTIRGSNAQNNTILSEMFADQVRQARRKKFPTAEDILEELGGRR